MHNKVLLIVHYRFCKIKRVWKLLYQYALGLKWYAQTTHKLIKHYRFSACQKINASWFRFIVLMWYYSELYWNLLLEARNPLILSKTSYFLPRRREVHCSNYEPYFQGSWIWICLSLKRLFVGQQTQKLCPSNEFK